MMYPLAYNEDMAVGFTTAPTGASGHVVTQLLTVSLGFDHVGRSDDECLGTVTLVSEASQGARLDLEFSAKSVRCDT